MKTITKVVNERPEFERLIRAVVRTVGRESLEDVIRGGAGAGWPGFAYYSDTVKFFRKHKPDIMALAKETAESLGEDLFIMIKNFNVFRGMDITTTKIAEVIYTGKGEMSDQIENAMAWFALEEVARMFEE